VLAALLNALDVVGKELDDVKVVITGVGAAGIAVTDILLAVGVRRIVGCDREGALYRGRLGVAGVKAAFADRTNPDGERGSPDELLAGADVFIGLSTPGAVTAEGIARMADEAIVFCDGEPDAGSRPGGAAGRKGAGRRYGPLRLPESDQQRACVSGRLPRRPRRARVAGQRGDEGSRGAEREGVARRQRGVTAAWTK
jgi:hypothetical protein